MSVACSVGRKKVLRGASRVFAVRDSGCDDVIILRRIRKLFSRLIARNDTMSVRMLLPTTNCLALIFQSLLP